MDNISQPSLLLNEQICQNNINKMAKKARRHKVAFRPHMKTHQSARVGKWLRNAGVESITVSSVAMARYFAKHGWQDITIAFPCNIKEVDQINSLATAISLTLLVNNQQTARILQEELQAGVKVYIEIDTGANRTGLKVNDIQSITNLVRLLDQSTKLQWIGFYSHPGHSYAARSTKEILNVHGEVLRQVNVLRKQLSTTFGEFEVCVGDTPCCSAADTFEGINAISPGNFIFYDIMQHRIGSCRINDIATALVCPVVDIFPVRNEVAIYGGAIHFSKESFQEDTFTHFGLPVKQQETGWEVIDSSYVKALSQEHGLISCSPDLMKNIQVGDTLPILPVHSCLTANLMGEYTLLNGEKITQL